MAQSELAAAIGYHRCTVVYWESKGVISGCPVNALKDMLQVLGMEDYWTPKARARTWSGRDSQQEALDKEAGKSVQAEFARASMQASRRRVCHKAAGSQSGLEIHKKINEALWKSKDHRN